MEKNAPRKKKDKDANDYVFRLDANEINEMLKNLLASDKTRNGVILHNFKIRGMETDELIECLVLFLKKHKHDFIVLDVTKETPLQNKYIESSNVQESKLDLEESRNLEQIFAVIERLGLKQKTRELIEQRIYDAGETGEVKEPDNDRDLEVELLRRFIRKQEARLERNEALENETEKFGSENFEVKVDAHEFKFWFSLSAGLNVLKRSLMALTIVPFAKLLDPHQVGLPDPEYYRVYKK